MDQTKDSKPSPLIAWVLALAWLLFVPSAGAQPRLFFSSSSATQSSNTVQQLIVNGSPSTLLFTAGAANGVSRCTALGLDSWNGMMFLLDAGSNSLWSFHLNGSGQGLVRNQLANAPLSVALDVLKQKIYYTSSSSTQSGNTIQRLDYTGAGSAVLFSATGPSPGNGPQRCTALAVDTLNSRIFFTDAGSNAIWSVSLAGTGLTLVKSGLMGAPLDLALDVTNQLIYFTTSSATLSSNSVQRVAYNGTGLTTLLSASNGVNRCTSLDLDLPNARIYFSDSATRSLWSINLAGGGLTLLSSSLSPDVVRKMRLLPAASLITVVNTNDSGFGSLRQALANVASPGAVNFSSELFSNGAATIYLTSVGDVDFGPSALRIDGQVAIAGPGGTNMLTLTRSNAVPMRFFHVSSLGKLSLKNVSLTNGLARGFIGGSGYQRGGGGGGSAGLGGAIVNEGSLDLENCTFTANLAQGGDGAGTAPPWGGSGSGGGGAGLFGPGGAGGQLSVGGLGGPPSGGPGGSGAGAGTSGGVGGGGGGGGSGGAGLGSGPGGLGGFGGGGGGGGAYQTSGFPGGAGGAGGAAGFGGGGGGGGAGTPDGAVGLGGFGGGNGGQGDNSGNTGSGGGGGGGFGGAIFNLGGALGITNSTLSGNMAVGGAGGFVNSSAGSGSGLGGAVFNLSGTVKVLNATVAGNRADQGGGGIFNLGDGPGISGAVTLRNTIVAGTLNGAVDYAATSIHGASVANTGNNNLIQLNNGFSGGIVSSADPKLGPLAGNGGPGFTHALLNGSPALDAGDNTGLPATDQRGYPRIADGDGNGSAVADLGAVEQGLFRLRAVFQTAANIQLSGFQMFLTGEANRLYVTQYSTNLVDWKSFATNQSPGVEIPVVDNSPGSSGRRFYRAYAWP